ncbi:MAG TPA: PQQ-binding-like beta-propeller repeat protein, partial [Planctomycetota bacterium]|nr:PQQ-binding-like beta-propeller repeat protein [Planctomycetota bacterium]
MTRRGVSALLLTICCTAAPAADWPMWRHDANRSAATDEELADPLHPQWVRKYPPAQPTWPGAPRQLFDPVHQPVVAAKTMFLCLKPSDKLVALDVETGAEKWTFFAEGPMRFAPVCHGGRVFVGSDDGYLYCLDAASGKLLWKFRGGPSEMRLIGHDRLISTWPVSSGVVVADGKVCFSAGIWPFMDVFYHALDAGTGKVLWTNDETSTLFRAMSAGHPGATALSGPTPQGYALVAGDRLLIPCGRGLPACFDLKTGKFLYYESTGGGKGTVNSTVFVTAAGDYFFSGQGIFDAATGKQLRLLPRPVRLTTEQAVFTDEAAWDHRQAVTETYKTWNGTEAKRVVVPKLFDLPRNRLCIKAGRRLYAHNPGLLLAIDLPAEGEQPEIAWKIPFKETVGDMLAADGKLFVVTTEGGIHCFGPGKVEPRTLEAKPQPLPAVDDDWTRRTSDILAQAGVEPGYAVVLGIDSERLVEELVRQSPLHVIAVDTDEATVDALRRKLDAAGLYGERVSLHTADPGDFVLPQYFARLIVVGVQQAPRRAFVERLFRSLRPYGGVACFRTSAERHATLAKDVTIAALPGAEVKRAGDLTVLARVGPLEGAGTWTHDNGNAARQTCSTDRVARAPLGVLWFGGEAGGN